MESLTYPFDALLSYHYFRNDDQMERITGPGRLRLIGDSGAFSAFTQGSTIRLDEYADWIKRWGHRLYWVASLDVFGDPESTLANFRTLRDKYGLATVPTIHIGTDPAWLDSYAAEGVDFVGLGGMVKMPVPAQLRWLVHVLRYARDHHPQMRFHAWGVTKQSFLEKLPFYSVDSSGLLGSAYRYARLILWDSRDRSLVQVSLDGRDPYRHRRLLAEQYDVTPQQIERSHVGNKNLLIHLSALGVQRRAERLQQKHHVSPPAWGLNENFPPATGTRVHTADANIRNFRMLAGVWNTADEYSSTTRR